MRIVKRDHKTGTIKVVPQVLDDLYHLAQLIHPGDHVRAVTFRTAEHTEDIERRGKVEKKRMTLTLEVQDVEFHAFSDRLRIHGTITNGPQDLGLHHTFNIEADGRNDLGIQKAGGWARHELDRLTKAEKQAQQPLVYLLAMEEDEATLATVHHYGVREVSSVATSGRGKMFEKVAKDDFMKEVLHRITTTRPPEAPLIVVGPGWTRERCLEALKKAHPEHAARTFTDGTGQAGMPGIHEAIKRGALERVVKDHAVAEDTALFEALLTGIAKGDGLVTYGPDETQAALRVGAVETLLVTDRIVREGTAKDALAAAEQAGSRVHVMAEDHEAGRQLARFGGLAGLLRYRVDG